MSMHVVLLLCVMICCTVAANLCLKLGASVGRNNGLVAILWEPYILLGMALFGASALLYTWILRTLPLNIAQSFAAAQFISVIVASSYLLAEPVPPLRWFGIVLIAVGIVIVGLSIDAKGAPL